MNYRCSTCKREIPEGRECPQCSWSSYEFVFWGLVMFMILMVIRFWR